MTEPADLDAICYQRNFVAEVIVRIDFVSPIVSLQDQLPPEIARLAKKNFPIAEPKRASIHNVKLADTGPQLSAQQFFTQWAFHGVGRTKSVTFQHDALVLHYTVYDTYDQIRGEFVDVLNGLLAVFKMEPRRIGLRYVNKFNLPGEALSWDGYFNDVLLSLIAFGDSAHLSRVFHNIEFTYDDYQLRLQAGMPNPDYPSKIRQREFVVDIDAYSTMAREATEVPSCLDTLHRAAQATFELCVADELRKVLKQNG